ncbi:NAD-dependent epimerase/dehydratase family protein [Sphingobacterium puteale]|uniref:NAD-dependent epimerase/dehydratase family protein n=1 Tax=Sphingobacterium puteale TaxID=2420510 RepID=A0A420VV16_9SPHI|nr:NAD(P)H-binding protein [Sphingobacterium puteale]RKO70049.1 NAD-dependent epimerase/dehydratase family protein [Sphingobacterium puteale]
MKVAVIGSTGYVGTHLVKELVDRNYEVVALARHTENIRSNDSITKLAVDINNHDQLVSALTGTDVVVSAFNAGWTNPNLYEDFTKGALAIQEAVKDAGVKRFIVVGGAGSLLIEGNRLVDSHEFPKEIKPGALAAADYLDTIRKEDQLEWTMISPAIEMNPQAGGVRTGKYRTGLDAPVFDHEGRSRLSVEDLAVAIVDEIANKQFINKRFTAAY